MNILKKEKERERRGGVVARERSKGKQKRGSILYLDSIVYVENFLFSCMYFVIVFQY